jgi:hypothetical protein
MQSGKGPAEKKFGAGENLNIYDKRPNTAVEYVKKLAFKSENNAAKIQNNLPIAQRHDSSLH